MSPSQSEDTDVCADTQMIPLQVSFAAELEALRKDSASSSHKSSTSERTSAIAVDALRKVSTVSVDATRKASTFSDCDYDYSNPQESDATP